MARNTATMDLKKHPRTLTIVTSRMINNFDVLGIHYPLDNGVELRFHRHPQVNIRGDKVAYNFDIMIGNGKEEGFKFVDALPPHRYIELRRYDKFTQAIRLLRGYNQYRLENPTQTHDMGFVPVPTWFVGMDGTRSFPVTQGKVVVKPTDGARGIGQFVVDTDKVNLHQLNTKLDEYLKADDYNAEKFQAMLDKFEGHVTYHSVAENEPFEGLKAMAAEGAVVQSFIPKIVAEYRVLTNVDGFPTYFQKRRVRDPASTFPQATGGGDLIDMDAVVLNPLDDGPAQELFEYLCSEVIGPMNSIDLFVTDAGSWGIFEYCNQFGVTGIPSKIAEKLHLEFVYKAVHAFLVSESDNPSPEHATGIKHMEPSI